MTCDEREVFRHSEISGGIHSDDLSTLCWPGSSPPSDVPLEDRLGGRTIQIWPRMYLVGDISM